jgi:putative ABC transport system permease protein
MRTRDLLRYATGALRGHRLRTALSLLGVAIGVSSVILLTSLGEGARRYVVGEFSILGSNVLIVLPGKAETHGAAPMVSSAPNDLTLEDVDALLSRLPAVTKAAPACLGTGRASVGDRSRETTVVGTTHEMLAIRHGRMGTGRYLPEGMRDAPVCVIGAKVQRELFGQENPLGEMLRLGDQRFRIIGVMAAQGVSIGLNVDETVIVPVENAMRMFNRTSLFRVLLEMRSYADLTQAREAVIGLLKERHGGQEDVTVLTQDAVVTTFTQILGVLTAALVGIAAISLTVAGIGIMNVMLVSVTERTREVGLLKALGVTRRQVLGVFLLEAAIISSAGGMLGLLMGVAGSGIVRQLFPEFPAQAPLWAVALALAISGSVGVIFGILPARRAAALDPVMALMRRRA